MPMMGRLRAYLELVRVPNLFTSAADVLAGYLTVASVLGGVDGQVLAALLLSTVCLYGGGVVLNDFFDESLDRVERPERPLPSGRIKRRSAGVFAIGLYVVGAAAAAAVGPLSLALALAIIFAATFYDAVGKRSAFGPLNMGLCRFLNLLLGASAVPALVPERMTLALLLMVHVTGVTVLSRGEVAGGQRGATLTMIAALATVVVTMAVLGLAGQLPDPAYLYFLLAFVIVVGLPTVRVYANPSPQHVGLAVKWGVLGLVLLDAAFASAYAGSWGGLAVAALLIPSVLIARLFAVT